MSFPFFDETKELNEFTRKSPGGSFLALTDGVTHYQLSGQQDGIPVVLVHGFSVPSFIFDPTFKFLENSGFRVLRYDLIGRGFSDKPNLRYDIHLFVKQLKELLDAFDMQKVDLVGLSMGGPVTAAFIEKYPRYVRKHVLIDPSGARRVELPPLLKMVKMPILGELLLGLFGSGSMVKGIAADLFDPDLVEVFQEKYKIQMQYQGFKRAILSTMRNGMLDSFMGTYAKIGSLKKPTLLFWGENDATTPFEDHTLVLQTLPHAEFHAIPNCGHIPHYEKPDVVNPIVLEFLSR
ncbi:MAG: alpha/beta hydrolase [Anaerolineales bacterium]|jgi:pimeloyl-ACP methyl ester carboxylesterase|nr:alpha/beta hydrolase [Anaerolineales bacterium]